MREVYLALGGYQCHNQMGARSCIKAQEVPTRQRGRPEYAGRKRASASVARGAREGSSESAARAGGCRRKRAGRDTVRR